MASTGGCRLAYVAGLILGVMSLVGAQSGSLTEAPAVCLWTSPSRGRGISRRCSSAPGARSRGVASTQCHQDYRGRRNVWQQGQPVAKCQTCHGLRPEARRLDVKNAYHRQCKGCHLRLRQPGRQAGPITCQGCHRPA